MKYFFLEKIILLLLTWVEIDISSWTKFDLVFKIGKFHTPEINVGQ